MDTSPIAPQKASEPTKKAAVAKEEQVVNQEAEKRDSPHCRRHSSKSLTSLITCKQNYRCVTNANLESQKILVKIKHPSLSQR